MKITVTNPYDDTQTYEGEDLYPMVDDTSQRLDILDTHGRVLGIYPRNNWQSVNVEYDDEDASEDEAADSVGTAYIDIKPRFNLTEKDVAGLIQAVADNHAGIDVVRVTKR